MQQVPAASDEPACAHRSARSDRAHKSGVRRTAHGRRTDGEPWVRKGRLYWEEIPDPLLRDYCYRCAGTDYLWRVLTGDATFCENCIAPGFWSYSYRSRCRERRSALG